MLWQEEGGISLKLYGVFIDEIEKCRIDNKQIWKLIKCAQSVFISVLVSAPLVFCRALSLALISSVILSGTWIKTWKAS